MAYQSLYRRYRPARFGDLVGQQHVVAGLRNAVRDGRTGHAYLFSGPRGTGKTSTARILARALNCTALADGEPCGSCESCRSIAAGNSYDLFELDAASNNKVEDVRDLISRVAIGSPGRTKVYILDEVHMLSAAASNALLKTLEEPPEHVAFVLATTDPQKVLPTIRSRTQHFEFGLVPASDLERHIRWVIGDAGLDLDDDSIAWVVRKGAGSVRDALSALDQVAAVGGVAGVAAPLDELLEALCERDPDRALVGLASALATGRETRLVAEELLGRLRDAFLAAVAPGLSNLPDLDAARMADVARRLGTAGITRALEAVGAAVMDMRQAPDARVVLEVALIRLTRADLDTSVAALLERVARLEAALAGGVDLPPVAAAPAPRPVHDAAPQRAAAPDDAVRSPLAESARTARPAPDQPDAGPAATPREGAAAAARRQLAARGATPPPSRNAPPPPRPAARRPAAPSDAAAPPSDAAPAAVPPTAPDAAAQPDPTPAAAPPAGPAPAAPVGETGGELTVEQLTTAWASGVLDHLPPGARALYRAGHFAGVEAGVALFALPSQIHRDRCEAKAVEVERSLAAHFGRPVPLRLVVDGDRSRTEPTGASGFDRDRDRDHVVDLSEVDDIGDVRSLEDAPSSATTGIDLLQQAFPGAEVVE